MYIVEVKNAGGACEKSFVHKTNAIKAASKAANAGFIYFDNPELHKSQRRFRVDSVRVYDASSNQDIDF